jgi:hypothetical protein
MRYTGVVWALTFIVAVATAPARGQVPTSGAPEATQLPQRIPTDVAYRLFLRHVAAVNERADALEKQGKQGGHLRRSLIGKYSLDSNQFAVLSQVAADLKKGLRDNDAQVQAIVVQFRQQYFSPSGQLLPGLSPPPPPPELKELGKQRRQLTMQAMERLHQSLGDEGFNALDQSIRSRFTPGIYRREPGLPLQR